MKCAFCDQPGYGPMLHDHVFQKVTAKKSDTVCMQCMEEKLGRSIEAADLRPCGMNYPLIYVLMTRCGDRSLMPLIEGVRG